MIMEIEKRRSKGSFLSLFDWNGKSQKKLFCDNPNLLEVSNQGNENVENMPKSQLNRIKVEDSEASPSNVASCDFNCALSIDSDEGCRTKAPGLVARLMGLDSLPASTVSELSSTSSNGSNSLRSSHCHEGALDSMADYCPVDYINMPLKPKKSPWDAMESKARKVENRPIKRFQTEMLPPKSAKPIPVSQNKLLSPIKSPGYILPKNAVHIMEAAAKIIEANPQPYMRNRMSSVGPSSVSLRILDLKGKLEAAQYASMTEKLVDPRTANPVNGKPDERSNSFYKSTLAFKGSTDLEKNSSHFLASKGKSSSLAIPPKAKIQSRDAFTSNGNRGYIKQKEQNEIKSNQFSRSPKPITDRAMQQRTNTGQNDNVLGQNNQKQNSVTNKGKSTSKIGSDKPTTRTWSSESSSEARKTTNKGAINANIEPKRSSTRAADTQKEFPLSKRKSISQKKRYVSRDVQNEARRPDKAVNNYESKSIKCNITTDGSIDQDAFNMKESKDVISFTFTSPLRRNMPESQSSTEQVVGTRNTIHVNSVGHSDKLYPQKRSLSPPGLHIINGIALSVLLEKKLQELTSSINLPQCTLATEGSSADLRSSLHDKFHDLGSITSKEQDRSFHPDLLSNRFESMHDYGCSSIDDLVLNKYFQLQTSEAMEEPCCSSNSASGNDLGFQHSRAVTAFETPFVSESYLGSEESTYGSTVYSSMQDEEVSNYCPINESVSLENEMEWSEQSSSTMVGGNMATIKQLSAMSNLADFKRSRNMEYEYVKDILSNAELMAEEFVMGQTDKVLMPNLFDMLENQSNGTEDHGEFSKLERKVLFDCVSEYLELTCREAFVGSCKAWPEWVTSVERKSWLAEELYKEIMMSFRSMEGVMVDELVSRDMSTRWGKWLDFDIEAFEEGLEVELDILTCLINELVSDLLLV